MAHENMICSMKLGKLSKQYLVSEGVNPVVSSIKMVTLATPHTGHNEMSEKTGMGKKGKSHQKAVFFFQQ